MRFFGSSELAVAQYVQGKRGQVHFLFLGKVNLTFFG